MKKFKNLSYAIYITCVVIAIFCAIIFVSNRNNISNNENNSKTNSTINNNNPSNSNNNNNSNNDDNNVGENKSSVKVKIYDSRNEEMVNNTITLYVEENPTSFMVEITLDDGSLFNYNNLKVSVSNKDINITKQEYLVLVETESFPSSTVVTLEILVNNTTETFTFNMNIEKV